MYVCLCNGITEKQIRDAIRGGADSLLKLRFELGVASCCGRCTECAQQVIEETLAPPSRCNQLQAA
ncbi:MAG TPA: bacterioferritin-associated ferredoxin [Burkholderiales bacterium]|nr:bacterioferritin-associated ferredoxin [Burkholderiales bacterium]